MGDPAGLCWDRKQEKTKLKAQTAAGLEAALCLYPAGNGACSAPPPPGPGEEPCLSLSISAHKGQAAVSVVVWGTSTPRPVHSSPTQSPHLHFHFPLSGLLYARPVLAVSYLGTGSKPRSHIRSNQNKAGHKTSLGNSRCIYNM